MSVDAPLGAPPQSGAFDFTSSADRAEPARTRRGARRRSWLEPAAVAAVPILGLLLCVAGTRTNALVPQSVRPVLWPMAGPFYFIGFTLSSSEVVAAIVMLFLSYALAVWYADRVSARTVIVAIVALNVIVLLGPPLFSTDVFSYQAYARMFAIYHTNPYTHGPSVIQLDGIYNYIGAKWISTPSVYGPLFTFISAALASASIPASEFAFKLIAALASGGTLYLIWQCAKQRGVNPVRGIALFGLSPLVTLYGVGGGHNDLLMLLFTTAGVYAMLTRREGASGALITAAAAIKLTGGVLLPFALAGRERPGSTRHRRRFLVGAAGVAVIVAAASFAAFGTGVMHLSGTLQTVQDEGDWQSVPGFLFSVAGLHVTHLVRLVFDVALAAALLWLLRRVWLDKMGWIEGASWATFALLVTAWAMLPWYVSWMLPLVALCRSRRLWAAALFLTAVAGAMMIAECLAFS